MEIISQTNKPVFRFNTVMLIDDSSMDTFINRKVMESIAFARRIYHHTNGLSAIEFLSNLSVQEEIMEVMLPDIIFVDVNMPVMDGFQFIEQFYQLPPVFSQKCRIVVLSSSVNESDKNTAHKLNPEIVFINKPLLPEHLFLIP
jgi:CheY-like chemotaxis protein